jgi:Fur family ferric uptake transcriptional regulator
MTSTDPGRTGVPRRTRQRAEIRAAVEALDGFATAQEIHDRMRHDGLTVGLATVYRTLTAMAATGEIDAIRAEDGQVAYRTCSPGHHHHLVCRSCGRTDELTVPGFEELARTIAAEHGFSSIDHELEFFGTCAACASQPSSNTVEDPAR